MKRNQTKTHKTKMKQVEKRRRTGDRKRRNRAQNLFDIGLEGVVKNRFWEGGQNKHNEKTGETCGEK